MTITVEVSYATGGYSGRLVAISAEVSYAAGGHSRRLVPITAESFICNWSSFRKISDHHC